MRVTTFLVFISMWLMMSLNMEEVEAIAFCYTNGCDFRFNLPLVYKRHFKLACHKHDACYDCVRIFPLFIEILYITKKGLTILSSVKKY